MITEPNQLPAANRGGRPSKFTPETRRHLIRLISKGVPVCYACSAIRISHQAFRNWLVQYPDFALQIERATGHAIARRLAIIEKAAESGDTGCARWLLEHLHPEYFSKSRIEISGPNGASLVGAVAIYLPQKDGERQTEVRALAEPSALPANGSDDES